MDPQNPPAPDPSAVPPAAPDGGDNGAPAEPVVPPAPDEPAAPPAEGGEETPPEVPA